MVDRNDLQDDPECLGCGEIGRYEGKGRTSMSNWTGRPFVARYCPECDERYYVLDKQGMTPTL